MKLYKTKSGIIIEHGEALYMASGDWDMLVNRDELYAYLEQSLAHMQSITKADAERTIDGELLAPVGSQELWAAGVTYWRSRAARMEESETEAAASLYDKVYEADRPELFFKAQPHRIAAHGEHVNIRRDSVWNVPEPELTLYLNSAGNIQGYTVGNDVSSRSIEGENALYLPQAKIWERSAALGPCLYVPDGKIDPDTIIRMNIRRGGAEIFNDVTSINKMKRTPEELAGWLYRGCDFAAGCYLMTGTCLVPGNDFTLLEGDVVEMTIDGIGTLRNDVRVRETTD